MFRAYGITYPPPAGAYELDHLIPLELGCGNAAANLWPQPYRGSGSADVKDHLHALVCSGQLSLATAQMAIAGDWYAAQTRYGSTTVRSTAPVRTAAPQRTSAPVPAENGATAQCNDGTFSYAAHHQGACSRHGGAGIFYR